MIGHGVPRGLGVRLTKCFQVLLPTEMAMIAVVDREVGREPTRSELVTIITVADEGIDETRRLSWLLGKAINLRGSSNFNTVI